MNVYGTAAVNVQTKLFPLMVRSAPLRAWRTMLRIAARTMQARSRSRASPFETPASQAPQGEGIN